MNKILLCLSLFTLLGCGAESPYRDTSELELPPAVKSTEPTMAVPSAIDKQARPEQKTVLLDDSEKPPVLIIKKFQDRAWELVIEALNQHKIEIIDKNREAGSIQVKYDASEDGGETFGNVRFFWFEDEYGEARYEIKLAWNGVETEVKVHLLEQAESEDDEDLADGSEKLVKMLYNAIKAIVNPEEQEQ